MKPEITYFGPSIRRYADNFSQYADISVAVSPQLQRLKMKTIEVFNSSLLQANRTISVFKSQRRSRFLCFEFGCTHSRWPLVLILVSGVHPWTILRTQKNAPAAMSRHNDIADRIKLLFYPSCILFSPASKKSPWIYTTPHCLIKVRIESIKRCKWKFKKQCNKLSTLTLCKGRLGLYYKR